MKITDKPVIVFLGAVVGAFLAGIAAVIWLDSRIESTIDRKLTPPPQLSTGTGILRYGNIEIYWGNVEAQQTSEDTKRDRQLTVKFPAASFIEPPTVTFGVSPVDSKEGSFTYAFYKLSVDSNGFSGTLRAAEDTHYKVDDQTRNDVVKVAFVAVGRWR